MFPEKSDARAAKQPSSREIEVKAGRKRDNGMKGPKGKSHGRFIKDEKEHENEDGSTKNNSSSTNPAREHSLAAIGQHSTATTASPLKGAAAGAAAAAVVPAAGGGSSPEEDHRVEEQNTLREQLEALVSHKLKTLGDLDHAGLAALEALNKLPAARDQPPASGDSVVGGVKKKILPLGLEKINKFSGKDPNYLTDCLNQFYSLVVAALPASSPSSVNKALTRDVVFVLEGSALKFFNSLKAGCVEWEPTPPAQDDERAQGGTSSQQKQRDEEDGRGGKRFRPPSTWTELYDAFHDHYLPVTGIARTSEKLFSSTQAPDESVLTLAQRQLGLATHLHRLIEANGKQIDFMEAISIRLFERALRADLRRIQDAEPPCSSFQESVDRAERNAIKLAKKPDRGVVAQQDAGGGSCASTGPVAVPAARSTLASSEGRGGVSSGATPKHAHKSHHGGSERDGGEERWGATAPRGLNAVGRGRDEHHEAGEILPDDGFRPDSTWQAPDGGEREGPGFEQRHQKMRRGQKRARDWQETHHGGGADQRFSPPQRARPVGPGAYDDGPGQPFPPPQQRARPVDPGASPPCTLDECRTTNRNFHSSNDCFYHPIHGERNRMRGNPARKKTYRRNQPDGRGPQHHNGGFGWGSFG